MERGNDTFELEGGGSGSIATLPVVVYDTVRLVIRRDVFSDARDELHVPIACLTSLVDQYAHDLPPEGIWVGIADRDVSPDLWDRTKPKPGQSVYISYFPLGGGPALQIGVALGLAALTVYTGGATSGLLASYGFSAGAAMFGGALAASAVGIGGALAMQSLFAPPKQEKFSSERGYSITGTSNRIAQIGQVIPYVAGHVGNVFPLHVAEPYTTTEDGEQYMHCLLSPGFGPLDITNITVGGVTIGEYPDLEYEVREGRSTDAATTLYPRAIFEAGPSFDMNQEDGPYVAGFAGTPVDRMRVEVAFPNGLFRMQSNGKRRPWSRQIRIEYQLIGAGSWTTRVTETITAETSSQFRKSWWIPASSSLTRGEYQVRITILSGDVPASDQPRFANQILWTSLQGRLNEVPVQRDDIALIALRFQAGPSANGIIRQITCDCTRYQEHWVPGTPDGAWVEQTSNNPAACYRDILQHEGANAQETFPDVLIDLAHLSAWSLRCFFAGNTFGMVFSDEGTTIERLEAVAQAGIASHTVVDGKITVIEDLEQTTVIQKITPHNSSNFERRQSHRRTPHALRVAFINELAEWKRSERLVYDDGFSSANASQFDDLDLTQIGVTHPDRAWEHGRRWIARDQLRRWTTYCTMGFENIAARRGELVKLAHTAVLTGLNTGRLKSVTGANPTALTLEGPVLVEPAITYAIGVRYVTSAGDSAEVARDITNTPGLHTTLTLASSMPAGVRAGDLFSFGPSGLQDFDCIVKNITRAGDRTARLELVPHAQPGIEDSLTGTIPEFDPGITKPQGTVRAPRAPRLVSVRKQEIQPKSSAIDIIMIELTAIIQMDPGKGTSPEWYRISYREIGAVWQSVTHPAVTLRLPFMVPFGYIYEVRVSALATDGAWLAESVPSNIITVDCTRTAETVVNLSAVTGLELVGRANGTQFVGKDAHFRWRMTSTTGASEVGEEPNDGDGFTDATFSHWTVTMYTGATNEVRRVDRVMSPEYSYTYEKNYADALILSPTNPMNKVTRRFTIAVTIVDKFGRESAPATLTVSNPAPALPLNLTVSTNVAAIYIGFDPPSDPDWIGMIAWASETSGFTPGPATLLGKTPNAIAAFNVFADNTPITSGTTYYIRIAAYDVFGDEPELLNVSSEFAETTVLIDITALPQFTFDPPPQFMVTLGPGPTADRLTWTASTVYVTQEGVTNSYNIAAGQVDWTGATRYVYYVDGLLILNSSTDPTLHTLNDRTLMAVWSGELEVTAFNGRAGFDGAFMYAQTITGNALAVGQAIITEGAQIAAAIINTAHVDFLDVDKLLADSILTKRIFIGSSSFELIGQSQQLRISDSAGQVRVRLGKLQDASGHIGAAFQNQAGNYIFTVNHPTLGNFFDGLYIADATIKRAAIGLLQVDEARIDNLTVGTGKIANDAVTRRVVAFTSGFISIDPTADLAQEVTLDVESGEFVYLQFACSIAVTANNSAEITIRIDRDSTTLVTGTDFAVIPEATSPQRYGMSFTFRDSSPPAGMRTYSVYLDNSSGSGANPSAGFRGLYALQGLK